MAIRKRRRAQPPVPPPPPAEADAGPAETWPDILPVLPLGDLILFPGMVAPLIVQTPRSMRLVEAVSEGGRLFIAAAQKDRGVPDDQVAFDGLAPVGCVTRLLRLIRFPDDTVRILVQGLERCRLIQPADGAGPYLTARYEITPDQHRRSVELSALVRSVSDRFQEVVTLSPTLPDELKVAVINVDEPGRLADLVAAHLNLALPERQALLAESSVKRRLETLVGMLNREHEVLRVGAEIQSRVQNTVNRNQRDFFLREQLKAIRHELGERDQVESDLEEITARLQKAALSEEARTVADRELGRLQAIPTASPEYGVVRNYLDLMASLPWAARSEDRLDLDAARKVLDADHYGMESVKERLIEYLAVLKLKQDLRGPILCLLGPPGVGKTSLGQSIARALGRTFVRIALGGMHDEGEIRGHRRTYIGAMPGRIIQSLRRAGVRNPVFMLDEIDKVGSDFRGDPSSALLEVLDPEQNHAFSDHYLDVPFDLSGVLFLTTANVTHTIQPPLLDRMEVLEMPGYTQAEKRHIARGHLLPRQIGAHGLKRRQFQIEPAALDLLIGQYTREAGVRQLDRALAGLCRKTARRVASGRNPKPVRVTPAQVKTWLGPAKFPTELAEPKPTPGVVTGLAWTPVGGALLFIEVRRMKGKERLTLTGSLGEVMKESAQAALSYLRSEATRFGLDPEFAEGWTYHIHVPSGAVPKDGPSAGLALVAALLSCLRQQPVSGRLAMTGEITLRGRVLAVGGVKEKVLAAAQAGIDTILLPEENRSSLNEIPLEIRRQIRFRFVKQIPDLVRLLKDEA